jgi:hypothetical protein
MNQMMISLMMIFKPSAMTQLRTNPLVWRMPMRTSSHHRRMGHHQATGGTLFAVGVQLEQQ